MTYPSRIGLSRRWFNRTMAPTLRPSSLLEPNQREGAEHVQRVRRRRGVQVGAIELIPARDAELAEAALDLVLEQLEDADDAALPGGGGPETLHAADPDRVGAEGERLADIGAALEAAVDDDLGAPLNRRDDLGQHLDRAAAAVELTPGMVRDADPFDAVIDGDGGVLGRRDALDHQRNVEFVLDQPHRAPAESG